MNRSAPARLPKLAARIWLCLAIAGLAYASPSGPQTACGAIPVAQNCIWQDGGIIRGPTNRHALALVFTAHTFGEGLDQILTTLDHAQGKASFFFTGEFVRNTAFKSDLARINHAGHYLGPHSDQHLLYCSWDKPHPTLVTRDQFRVDLDRNISALQNAGVERSVIRFFLPAYEHYNPQVSGWTAETGLQLINYTPGTRSNADYTGEADQNFVSTDKIFDSIVQHEREKPAGLNGFILLLHAGVGPGRKDKFTNRFPELVRYLKEKQYALVRVDDLLAPAKIK